MPCTLECRVCGKTFSEDERLMACPDCGEPLWVKYDMEALGRALKPAMPVPEDSCLRQWRQCLPLEDESLIERVSLGEGESPLLRSHSIGKSRGMPDLRFKVEMGPTLSLKDRGTAFCTLKAVEHGYAGLSIASSGNNAASVAAYAARAGLPAVVFIQEQVSPSKVLKSIAYGATVVRVKGGMPEASRVCAELSERFRWVNCGGPNPFRVAAKRLAGYEIVRQLGHAPDAVVMPCGGGAGLVSMHEAFKELLALGIIDKMPRLYGVQLSACNPTEVAWREGRDTVTPVEKKPSLSDAIMNNNPFWGKYDLMAARESGGGIYSVSDEEFVRMIRELGREEGLFTEPAGSVAVAALEKIRRADPAFAQCESVVCTLTGHGLNAPRVAVSDDELPEAVPATADAAVAELERRGVL